MLPPELLKPETWHTAPRPEYGDEHDDHIYRAVGRALSQWENLEVALSALFTVLVESRSPAAGRAYGALASATGRAEMLDRAAEVFFLLRGDLHQQQFDDLLKAVKWASPRRNDIAHGVVTNYGRFGTLGGGYYLVAPLYNTRRTDVMIDLTIESSNPLDYAPHKYAYVAAQIATLMDGFKALADETRRLCLTLFRELKRQKKAAENRKSQQPPLRSPSPSAESTPASPPGNTPNEAPEG